MSEALRKIRLVIFDVDGVLSDGGIFLDVHGCEMKRFHVRDGTGIKYLLRAGLRVAFLSGRESRIVALRAKELGVEDVIEGAKLKLPAYETLRNRAGVSDEEVCYVGDDLPDLPLLRRVGFPVAVADAADEVKAACALVTEHRGGNGAACELAEMILRAQDKWADILARYESPDAAEAKAE